MLAAAARRKYFPLPPAALHCVSKAADGFNPWKPEARAVAAAAGAGLIYGYSSRMQASLEDPYRKAGRRARPQGRYPEGHLKGGAAQTGWYVG
jgi:hypothetical protein